MLRRPRTVAFTSTLPDEGKTSLAVMLATIAAKSGELIGKANQTEEILKQCNNTNDPNSSTNKPCWAIHPDAMKCMTAPNLTLEWNTSFTKTHITNTPSGDNAAPPAAMTHTSGTVHASWPMWSTRPSGWA